MPYGVIELGHLLLSTEPLPKPIMTHSHMDPLEQTAMKLVSKRKIFVPRNHF